MIKIFIYPLLILLMVFCGLGYYVYTETKQFNNYQKQLNDNYKKYQIKYERCLKLFKEKYKKCYLIEIRGYGGTKYSVGRRYFYSTEYFIDKNGVLTLKINGKEIVICNQYIIEETTPEEYVTHNFYSVKKEFGELENE